MRWTPRPMAVPLAGGEEGQRRKGIKWAAKAQRCKGEKGAKRAKEPRWARGRSGAFRSVLQGSQAAFVRERRCGVRLGRRPATCDSEGGRSRGLEELDGHRGTELGSSGKDWRDGVTQGEPVGEAVLPARFFRVRKRRSPERRDSRSASDGDGVSASHLSIARRLRALIHPIQGLRRVDEPLSGPLFLWTLPELPISVSPCPPSSSRPLDLGPSPPFVLADAVVSPFPPQAPSHARALIATRLSSGPRLRGSPRLSSEPCLV